MHQPATTTTIETVTVVRPLKIIAFLCLLVAVALLIVSLSVTTWLKSDGFRLGLFEECADSNAALPLPPDAPTIGRCQKIKSRGKDYVPAVAALIIISVLLCLVALVLTGCGLKVYSSSRKFLFYRSALYVGIFAVILELIAMIVFPVCFYLEMRNWQRTRWDFDWAYGVAWGGTFFTFGACILLICDKEQSEVYYKEKTVVHAAS